ncbi:LysR family transcriptional regulator [Cocleimonas sp. KMM 6892]|uniref:LysR family transcriptional regulator n=1 Tax=unclassified Cocleimonas TaxID=2639732 RepID=UPI002DB71934|nr:MULTISPECIES: LysR family transcriptional regulator [unclassified Cocleimonas]MEB8433766.1 LysR family transcriptional regulator [Cocleimonas sp. KMM 6892]MEC4716577.1 LysR family transcriptional regulator [Cocleimonas sp. KMM 6895]MEC4746268.1 LysR family transcriptional regulator [Cocleimonas sp. KMM 6896]
MDISHLKTFLEIYKTRHFRKSAEKLFITQSAASARIKLLEDRLGVALFTRDKRNIEPTPAAHRFFKYAEMVVTGWDQAKQVVALPDEYELSISIACMADIWHLFLKNWIVEIKDQRPEFAFNLMINQSHDVSDLLINGALDLGFVFEPIQLPSIEAHEVLEFEIKLFSTTPNQTPEQALDKNYIKIDWGVSFEYEYSQEYKDQAISNVRTNYGLMAIDIMKDNGGAAYLPDLSPLKNDPALPLYEVENAFIFKRKLYALYRKDTEVHENIAEIINTIKTIIA